MNFNRVMKNCGTTILLLWSVMWPASSVHRRIKIETTQKFNKRTGEAIAIDELKQKYERDHQKLYKEETRDGTVLHWPDLKNKNLSKFCIEYLQHSVPSRKSDMALGNRIERKLHYMMENTSNTSDVVIVQCKLLNKRPLSFYVTRALTPNCVYALNNSINGRSHRILTICNEFCDFEDKPLKRKRIHIIDVTHRKSGQPVAKDEYLLQFELEHQELLKKEGKDGKFIGWPCILAHPNLDYYCYQYLEECVPDRNRDGVRGKWKAQKLHYQQLNRNEYVDVIAITCESSNAYKLRYYMTRAPETHCVYALLRMGTNKQSPLVIIYKQCDFDKFHDCQTHTPNKNFLVENIIPKTEVKEEAIDALEILQLLPNN